MAECLASASIETTLIQDGAVFPIMSRINKIFLGCQTVLCNGGIRSILGTNNISEFAQFRNVPVSLFLCFL